MVITYIHTREMHILVYVYGCMSVCMYLHTTYVVGVVGKLTKTEVLFFLINLIEN